MDIRRLFGANLRYLRIQAGLSQEALGARAGFDRGYISKIELGQQNITLLNVWSLCEALDARPIDFFNEAVEIVETE